MRRRSRGSPPEIGIAFDLHETLTFSRILGWGPAGPGDSTALLAEQGERDETRARVGHAEVVLLLKNDPGRLDVLNLTRL